MSDTHRDDAARQANGTANAADPDVDGAAPGVRADVGDDDLKGETTYGEDDVPHPDRSTREPQE